MNQIYLSIGGNLGNRDENLKTALQQIEIKIGRIVAFSEVYETQPWGMKEQPDFLNQVLKVDTNLSPFNTLEAILAVEKKMGRIREHKWFARLIDIDLLFYNDEVIYSPQLTLPHPQIQNRNFVLVPFFDINPNFIHPVLNKTISQLYEECQDTLRVVVSKNIRPIYPF